MKKYSSLIIIGVLLILTAASIYLYRQKGKSSSVEDRSRNFGYRDTALVDRILIADKEGDRSEIKRTKEGWFVNGKYKCRSEAILNLLEVIRNVEVKMPVPREAKENVLRFMSTNAMYVEIYADDELVRKYYVGHETPDGEASYMLLSDPETGKNFPDPYACFIPGFTGYLQPRYIAKENEWRDRIVLNYIPPQMKRITVKQLGEPADSSFSIDLLSTTQFRMSDGAGREITFDNEKLRQYLVYFQNISYEALITGKNRRLQDSLQKAGPFCEITVTSPSMKNDVYRFYRKKFTGEFNPDLGVKYEYDPDRLYMTFDNGREWAIIQYFVFGKLLVNTSYFTPRNSVKK